MKTIKTLICAIAVTAAVAFSASSAKAYSFLGTVTNYDVLNVSLTIKTNIYKETSSGVTFSTGTAKLVNKDILNILSGLDFFGAPFPAGAKLVVGWDEEWYGDVLVVDSTGTNVIYNADSGGQSTDAYFYVDFYSEKGSYTGNLVEKDPGHLSIDWSNSGSFELYDDDSEYFYLWGNNQAATSSYTQNWNTDGDDTTWSSSETFSPSGGDQTWNGNDGVGSITGNISSSGHGKGLPYYLIHEQPF